MTFNLENVINKKMTFYRSICDKVEYFKYETTVYLDTIYGKFSYQGITDEIKSISVIDNITEFAGVGHNPWTIGVKVKINDTEYRFDKRWTERKLLKRLAVELYVDLHAKIKEILNKDSNINKEKEEEEDYNIQNQFIGLVLQHARLVKIMKDQSLYEIAGQIDSLTEKLKISEDENKKLNNLLTASIESISQLRNEKEKMQTKLDQLKTERKNYKVEIINNIKKVLE